MLDVLYLIEWFDPKYKLSGIEADRERTRANVVQEIADGMHEGVFRVLEIRMDAKPEDITEAIVREIRAKLVSECRLPAIDVLRLLDEVA